MTQQAMRKKWGIILVIVAILLVTAIVMAVVFGGTQDNPVGEILKESPIGVYYYDTAEGEYVLTLSDGNVFTIAGPNLNKSGKCVVTDNGIELDFVKDEDGIGSVVIDGDMLTLQYKDKTMRFLEKKTFKVSFDVNGGSAVETVKVINGKTVSKPADPSKEGNVFIGWYADEGCTQLYGFGTDTITADTTIYAKWVDTVVGQNEYVVDFDLGYEAEDFAAMTTAGGKLYHVPVPEREGYTFGGWWVSMTERRDQLTVKYTEDMVFQANTTLFAVWEQPTSGGKLAAPMVEVYAESISWNAIKNASNYKLKITDAQGNVIIEENRGGTTINFNFEQYPAGEYTIEVTALSATEANNSETTVRTFINKMLDRVSLFTVIDGGILLWNRVAGAEKYLITVDCGNDAHNHTDFDNGESGTFMFVNCPMQEGGIKFIVTAVAEGKASSVSEVFVYERKLEAVGQILYDEQTQSFYWDAVANATNYRVVITIGEETLTVDNGSATSYCVKHLSGNMTVQIIPETKGYNSPEATTITYEKKSLATPQGLTIKGNLLSWNEVTGADSYTVKINNQTISSKSNTLDLTTVSVWDKNTTYEISVMANSAVDSLYSDVVTMTYLSNIKTVSYKYNTVSWTPVIGVEKYEIRVNGVVVASVENATSARIQLKKAGVNVIEVRYTDKGGSDWTATEVFAYTVTYDSRSLSGVREEYLAMGDTMSMPTDFTHDGYEFAGWYNSPDGAAGNGAAVTDTRFNGNGSIVLYANWTPKTFHVEFKGMNGVSNIVEGEKYPVTYMGSFKLPMPEASDAMGEFVGWFTGPGGSGVPLTDKYGNSLNNYQVTRDTVAYPFFESNILEYIPQADGTYAVKAGLNIANATNVYIPEYHDGCAVTTILEYAFYNVDHIERIYIPATIKTIGVGAFPQSTALMEINVYTDVLQENYEVYYSSYDGALLRHDMGTVFLEFFPRGKTGEYTIPDNVDVIMSKVFYVSQISKLIVGNKVSLVMRNAFYGCRFLQVLEFKGEGTAALTIDPEAFDSTENLTTLRLPNRLAQMDLQILNQFTKLTTVEVESGGTHYSAVDNMICNADGNAILYAPKGVAGEYEIPLGIWEIGPSAFANCTGLTKITIPSYVDKIGDSAFINSIGITEVIFAGFRSNDLLIDSNAFSGCDNITTITFQGGADADTGVTTIGNSAFEGLDQLRTVIFENGTNIVIGQRAFAANEKLTNITYAENAQIQSFGKEAYAGCIQLTKAVIPGTLTSVGDGAFSGCEKITSVIFVPSDKNVTFGSNVFAGCFRLTTINLPATLGSFNSSVFAGCDSLAEIVVEAGNPNFATFRGALYSAGYEELLFYPRKLSCDNLSELLHDNLRKIGNNVFQGNPKVTNVHIRKEIVAIGEYAFENCYNLKSITFEAGGTVMTVGASAFAKCGMLTGIALPDYTSDIGDGAFEGTPLTAFVIPKSVTVLNNKLFKDTKLTSIHIPANVEAIGDDVFYNVPLTTITFAEGEKPLTIGSLRHGVSEMEKRDFGVFYGTRITNLVLPDRLVSIGDCAFYNQTTLTSVYMSKNSQLKTIGQYAFAVESGKSRLSTVSFGGSLEVISRYAFYKANLLDVTIPRTVTLVDKYAFSDNPYLRSIVFEMGGDAALTIEERAFANTQLEEINLPNRLEKIYTIVAGNINGFTGVAAFKNVCEVFHGCTKLKAVNVQEGNDTFVSKDGILYEISESGIADILLYCPSGKTGDLVISRDVRVVENGAFATTALSSITFEEYPKDDPNYGQPLLELGIIVDRPEYTPYAVFGLGATKNLTRISLPSHLKSLGLLCFQGLTVPGTTITFNMDSHVEAMANNSFGSCSGIKKLELPPVDSLGEYAFSNCSALTEVKFDPRSNIKVLPAGLFSNCGLVSIEIPATVREIGDSVFQGCAALNNVTFEEGSQLTKMGENVFGRCTSLTNLVLPENVTTVGMSIINGCTRLESITLSKNLMRVTSESNGYTVSMFSGCTALESIYVPKDSIYFRSVGGVLYDLAKTIIYCFPQAKDPTGFKLPDTLITIEAYAFEGFKGAEVILPESLETIGDGAFLYTVESENDDAWLKRVHIPKNVKTIGARAFTSNGSSKFVSIESLTFAEGSKLETIGAYAFAHNHLLKKVVLPDSVSEIGAGAFSWCVEIEEIILPASLKALRNNTFCGLRNLKRFVMQEGLEIIERDAVSCEVSGDNWALTELAIPSTVQEIQKNAFAGMHGLQTVTFAKGSQLKTLGNSVFLDCESLQSITLPSTITTLGFSLFDGCSGLKSVDMSACVDLTDLSSRMFRNCTSVETMLLPPNLTTIGSYMFGTEATIASGKISYIYGMTSLKQIEIPATVSSIGDCAFNGCTGLEKVVFEAGSRLISLGANVFADTPALREVVLPDNLRSIGPSCFEDSGVQIINLPITVTIIDDCAFKNCDNLVNANLTGSVAYLGDEVYYDCDKLEKADLYLGMEYIGDLAFAYCEKLKEVYIPATVIRISGNPFMGCTGVKSLELDPNNVDFALVDGVLYDAGMYTLIYYPAFLNAETFQFPATVFEIATGAFAGAQLKSIVIPEQIKQIPASAFRNSAMESVILHKGITAVGDHAFADMANLKKIFLAGNVGTISATAFADLAVDVNIYFMGHTRTEIMKLAGIEWIINASGKAHFYFKDTIPADVEWPEEIKPAT